MKFNDYINQKEPQHLPLFSVEVNPDECEIFVHQYRFAGETIIIKNVNIYIIDRWYSYRCDDYGKLFTTDKDGNKREPSVFRLKK